MNTPSIGFVGGGRITRIFLEGWTRAGRLPASVTVSDKDPAVLGALKQRIPSVTTSQDNRAAAAQDIVFLAVHPPALPEVAGGIAGALTTCAQVVSLAPKFTSNRLQELLGGFSRLSRCIPNAPSLTGHGFNPIAFGSALPDADRALLKGILGPLGESPEVAEEKIEAYAVLSAMGPTYLWFQMQALRELASEFGLVEDEINTALKSVIVGSLDCLINSGLTPGDVMDLIPVKPLAEMEASVKEFYRTRLPAIYQKIKP